MHGPSPVTEEALCCVRVQAAQSEGELHLPMAGTSLGEQRAAADLSEEDYAARVEDARSGARLARAAGGRPGRGPDAAPERGDPHVQILEKVEQERPDDRGRGIRSTGGRPGCDEGTVAERVLPQVEESILCFKPKDFVCPVS